MEKEIENRTIPFVVLEIGCNHMGQLDLAKKMVECAAYKCGVSAVKFQKRNNYESLSIEQRNAPHPHPENSYGKTYGEHRDFLEFTLEQHAILKKYCETCGIVYSTSVWDLTSAKEIASLNPLYIKVPSAQNTNFTMLEWLCENYRGEIQVSLGMTTPQEEEQVVEIFKRHKNLSNLTFMACTSGYPITNDEACLLEIVRLKEKYGGLIKRIGISGHYTNSALDIAAYVLGAEVIERHFTFDKTWKGTDHSASMVPEEVIKLMTDLNAVCKALKYKEAALLPVEKEQHKKLKYKNQK